MKPSSPAPLSLYQLSLYNTGRMSPAQVIEAFGARRPLLERLIAEITAEKPKSRPQHHLIVGQRGMGKTMLLARIAAELRTQPDLQTRFIPLVFAEEQYAVDRLSKFWLNCLDSLADAREFSQEAAAVKDIDDTVKALIRRAAPPVKDDQAYADEVYAAFAKAAQASGQRPVLLVDNLQLVFERLEAAQQHSLRELLMRPGSPILIGASPSPPAEHQDYGAAFYDQFKVHYLRPLDEDEMRDLMLHLATAARRDDVRDKVLRHPARLKVLRQLTGGNPRTTLTLFFLYAEDFAPSVFGDLEGLLDRVTPLYKARFEELTPQQQVITSAIANHWDPVTGSELTALTALPASTISSQLDRLEKTGTLERVELFGETRTGYMIAERFFNIWFLMRSASRRQRREVEFLTRFLENFYEPAERNQIAKHLMNENCFTPDRYLWSCAVAASLTEPEMAEELKRHGELLALSETAAEARQKLNDFIDFNSLPKATLNFDALRRKLVSMVPVGCEIAPDDFAKALLGERNLFISPIRQYLAASKTQLTSKDIQIIHENIQKLRKNDENKYTEEAVTWLSHRLASGQIRDHHDIEDWNRAFHQSDDPICIRLMIDSLPDEFGKNLDSSSIDKITSTQQPNTKNSGSGWVSWGASLQKLGLYKEAEIAYKRAIDEIPAELAELSRSVDELRVKISKFNFPKKLGGNRRKNEMVTKVEEHNKKLEVVQPFMLPGAWTILGRLYQDYLHIPELAEKSYLSATNENSQYFPAWYCLGTLYFEHYDRMQDAAVAFEHAYKINPTNEPLIHNLIFIRRDFMDEISSARHLMDDLEKLPEIKFTDTRHLQKALFAAYDSNWGLARESLAEGLALRTEGFNPETKNDWIRASAVLLHLNYGMDLLTFLDGREDTTARLRPWVEALRALQIGDKRALQNIAPETRTTAESFYDDIERWLLKLPDSSRRRPAPPKKLTRKKRK